LRAHCLLFPAFGLDFWTTRCTRCSAALDRLNERAQEPQNSSIQFISICCDQLDGAREIIEKEDDQRWSFIHHYYMSPEDKELAKQVLGFKSVPFYVFLNDQSEIVQMGNKVDFDSIPGAEELVTESGPVMETESTSVITSEQVTIAQQEERVFVIDEDF
jgi:hypothetical protein